MIGRARDLWAFEYEFAHRGQLTATSPAFLIFTPATAERLQIGQSVSSGVSSSVEGSGLYQEIGPTVHRSPPPIYNCRTKGTAQTWNSTAEESLYLNVIDLAKWDHALLTSKLPNKSTIKRMWTVFPLKNENPIRESTALDSSLTR